MGNIKQEIINAKAVADLWLLETVEHYQDCEDENCELWHRFRNFLKRHDLEKSINKLKLAVLRPE